MIFDLEDNNLNRVLLVMIVLNVATGIVQIIGHTTFQRMRHLQIIKKRFPKIVQTQAIVAIVLILIIMPIHYLNKIWLNSHKHDLHPEHELLRGLIQYFLVPPATYFLSHTEATRLYLIYFRLKLLQSHQAQEWGLRITSNLRADYYIANRKRMGSAKWMASRVAVYWIVISAVTSLALWYNGTHDVSHTLTMAAYLGMTVLMLCPQVLVAVVWLKLPKNLMDNMMMDTEFKTTCCFLVISVVAFLCNSATFSMGYETVTYATVGVSTLFTYSAPSLLATVWIPRKINKKLHLNAAALVLDDGLVLERGLFKDRVIGTNGVRTDDIVQEMKMLYADERKMAALMAQMARDFTVESFLCFVEIAQFKSHIVSMIEAQNARFDGTTVVRLRYQFYGHCPQSSIVFNRAPPTMNLEEVLDGGIMVEMGAIEEEKGNEEVDTVTTPILDTEATDCVAVQQEDDAMSSKPTARTMSELINGGGNNEEEEEELQLAANDVECLKHSASLLYTKYIAEGADLEINICGPLRQHFNAMEAVKYETLSTMDWVRLYDGIVSTMERYMLGSYRRMISRLHRAEQEENAKR